MPTNAQIRVRYDGELGPLNNVLGDVQVRDSAGVVVASTPSFAFSLSSVVLEPSPPLAPGATYGVWTRLAIVPCSLPDCKAGDYVLAATFTTGASPDTTPPVFAGITGTSHYFPQRCDNSACCGPFDLVLFDLNWPAAMDDEPTDWLRYDVYQGGLAPSQLLANQVTHATLVLLCDGAITDRFTDFAAYARSGPLFVKAVDMAGNEDSNTTSVPMDITCAAFAPDAAPASDGSVIDAATNGASDSGGGCSCQTATNHANPNAPVLLLVVLVLAMRKPRRPF